MQRVAYSVFTSYNELRGGSSCPKIFALLAKAIKRKDPSTQSNKTKTRTSTIGAGSQTKMS